VSTLAQRILDALEGEVGVVEQPAGSNRGPRVEAYQASTSLGGTGWPWCAALYCWALQQAGVDAATAKRIASPSTAVMCQVARSEGLVTSPRPGAAIVWCGTHVETLHTYLGGGVWRCIGGNTGDGVRWTTRSVSGALVYGPPGLEDAGTDDLPPVRYWLEDPAAEYRVVGPWAHREWAEARLAGLDPEVRAQARVVEPGSGGYAIRIGPPRHYGPWASKDARDRRARPALEARLGRELRPYRTGPRPAAAEQLGKTT
jgi:hypothetical protein